MTPGDDFSRKCLADVLMKRNKYVEAEPIYRELLQHTSDAGEKAILDYRLAKLLEATGRNAEADGYMKEYLRLLTAVK